MEKENHFNHLNNAKIGAKAPRNVNVIIEIPKDSHLKYEFDKETGLLKLDRFLYSAVHYPGDYGFIPQTLWEDNDPLDVLVLTHRPVYPMTLASVRVIGVFRMLDDDEKDDKIIAVYDCDPRYQEVQEIGDIPAHVLAELKNFFESYKELQGKKCKILKILGKKAAHNDILLAQKMYYAPQKKNRKNGVKKNRKR